MKILYVINIQVSVSFLLDCQSKYTLMYLCIVILYEQLLSQAHLL
jgi:hypothetical protein